MRLASCNADYEQQMEHDETMERHANGELLEYSRDSDDENEQNMPDDDEGQRRRAWLRLALSNLEIN
ncbi:hypothetical protein LTR85_011035 [Meristemomyces frigidus]|nr:hypothetical protein LTR85_011035 [Meristemomyces frigidus]